MNNQNVRHRTAARSISISVTNAILYFEGAVTRAILYSKGTASRAICVLGTPPLLSNCYN